MKIVILNTLGESYRTFFTPTVQERLDAMEQVVMLKYDGSEESKELLLRETIDAQVLITCWGVPELNDDFYKNARNLKMIAHTGGSVADLVNDSLKRSDVLLLSGNRYYAESVAEATICYMLAGQRKLYQSLKQTEYNGWGDPEMYNAGLYGKTIGLLSFGMIAENVARMLQAFHVHVKVCSSHQIHRETLEAYGMKQVSAEELFSTCDIISIHSAMTPNTYHSVNRELLSLMKQDALLVNTSRGAVIDEAALAEVLRAGKIRAVLDVFTQEPLAPDSPLRGLDNAVLVPHKGGPTIDMREVTTMGLLDDMEAYFRGEQDKMKNIISMEYAKRMTSHHTVEEGGMA